ECTTPRSPGLPHSAPIHLLYRDFVTPTFVSADSTMSPSSFGCLAGAVVIRFAAGSVNGTGSPPWGTGQVSHLESGTGVDLRRGPVTVGCRQKQRSPEMMRPRWGQVGRAVMVPAPR